MKPLLLPAFLIASVTGVPAQDASDTLAAKAAQAQAEGKARVNLGFTTPMSLRVESLDHVLERYDLAVASITDRITRVSEGRRIETWYKVRIEELLTERSPVSNAPPSTEITPDDYPPEFQPLAPWHVLLRASGGTVEIGGVELYSSVDNWPPLVPDVDYLVFLRLPPDHRLAGLPLLGHGVFRIRDGDVLEPVLESSENHIVWREIVRFHGASLRRFRRALRSRPNLLGGPRGTP